MGTEVGGSELKKRHSPKISPEGQKMLNALSPLRRRVNKTSQQKKKRKESEMDQLIVYEGEDEILVTTLGNEAEMLELWFDGGERNKEEYDRTASKEICIKVSSSLRVDA